MTTRPPAKDGPTAPATDRSTPVSPNDTPQATADVRGKAWWSLKPGQRKALEVLGDDKPHRTGRRSIGFDDTVHATVASALERAGMVRYEQCDHCGRGPRVPEVRITSAGLEALGP